MKSMSVALAMTWGAASGEVPTANYHMMWRNFRNQYPKTYTMGEEERRFDIFRENVDKIYAENAKGRSHQFGVTEFADMTSDEFNSMYVGGYNPELRSKDLQAVPFPDIKGPIPDAVDWVTKGGVTPVKNQQRCGSCWAFSTTGSVEGAYFAASGQLVSLSEEDLVQCDNSATGGSDKGCGGGLMDNAFTWIQQHGGICSETGYPYSSGTGITGNCTRGCTPVVTVSGHVDVPQQDEEALKKAVSLNPVSVAIEADKAAFQLYAGGVLNDTTCGTQLDHGVLIVGYGTDNGKDYWKVKNSWGPTWGENGYIRLARGKNLCGIALSASYPTGATKAAPAPPAPPSPPTPPSPSPSPSPSKSHYEDPKSGCQSDEVSLKIQGVQGAVCSPSCGLLTSCPKDLPSGVTAQPQCALQDAATHKKYCALICSPSEDGNDSQCGPNASCKNVQQGIGLCTYDDDATKKLSLEAEINFDIDIAVQQLSLEAVPEVVV